MSEQGLICLSGMLMSWLNSFISWFDYDWLRAGHILSVIAWMAGLLMMPRLIIYRLEGQDNPPQAEAMDKGALRLQKIILSPTMHASWTFGLLLIWQNWAYLHTKPIFWVKIAFVVLLTGAHFYFTRLRIRAINAPETMSSKKLRMINEIPAFLAIFIVIIAVVYL